MTEQLVVDLSDEKNFVVDEYRVFASVDYDSDSENPMEEGYGSMGTIRSLSTRHRNSITVDEFEDTLKRRKYAAVLSYHEHGSCRWFVRNGGCGGMSPADFRWDGVPTAGIWIPDKECMREIKRVPLDKRHEKARELAASACESYTAWCNGDVYCWNIQVYKDRVNYDLKDDYRFDEEVSWESCCGYYGDDIKNGILEMAGTLNAVLKSNNVDVEVKFVL